jgi:hypothetical protein
MAWYGLRWKSADRLPNTPPALGYSLAAAQAAPIVGRTTVAEFIRQATECRLGHAEWFFVQCK